MSTCVIVRLSGDEPLGRLPLSARTVGAALTVIDTGPGHSPLPRASDCRGIVVLGGPVSPYDDRRVPVRRLGQFLALAVSQQVPTLAIGGGAHLLTVALGGRATLPAEPIVPGLHTVRRTGDGAEDPLFSAMPAEARCLSWTLLGLTDLPDGARILAEDDLGRPQAVRFGPAAWGIQGHPESDRDAVADCLATHGHEPPADTSQAHRNLTEASRVMDRVSTQWGGVLQRFFDLAVRGPENASGPRG